LGDSPAAAKNPFIVIQACLSVVTYTNSLNILDHWLEANATWHRHPADVLGPVVSKRWYYSPCG
jgi:hypothetical protein